MKQLTADYPNQKIFIDVLGKLSVQSDEGHNFIFLVIDAKTKYVQAKALHQIRGIDITNALQVMYINLFSYPSQLISDNGLSSPEIKNFCKINNIDLTFISSYNPRSNGVAERSIKTIKNILYKLYHQEGEWSETSLSRIVFMYNCAIHGTTGFSPFFLFMGREPVLLAVSTMSQIPFTNM